MGGVLPREGSAAPSGPGAPKLPLDEPFVLYRRDERAAVAYGTCKSRAALGKIGSCGWLDWRGMQRKTSWSERGKQREI